MTTSNWPETRSSWRRFKANLADIRRMWQLLKAQRHAVKAMRIYTRNGCPQAGTMILRAMELSVREMEE